MVQIYYAQNREDLIIRGFFGDVESGFYIDIGASHPDHFSVTKLFYEAGWRGVNVDPIARNVEALAEERPRDINLHAGAGEAPGTLTFTEYPDGDGLSTFSSEMVDAYREAPSAHTARTSTYEVQILTLTEIMKTCAVGHVHFLKIDVEGFEYEVIAGHDWTSIRPELLCIEANHVVKDWRPILVENNYHEVFFDGLNAYFLAEESLHRRDTFDYAKAVLSRHSVNAVAARELISGATGSRSADDRRMAGDLAQIAEILATYSNALQAKA